MLAYVFWHWAGPQVPAETYEEQLRGFHRALSAHPPAGFAGCAALRLRGAPWLPAHAGYEDWYLVRDFTALGKLNDAAVTASRKSPHDRVARLAVGGIAGLYRLISGRAEFATLRFATWISKPAGTSYEQLFRQLAPWTEPGEVALWQRQMTLGPGTEFCLQAAEELALPEPFGAIRVSLDPVSVYLGRRVKRRGERT